MGPSISSPDPTSTLNFIQKLQDPNFGQVQIYRNQEGKFIMKTQKTFLTNDKSYEQFKQILQFIKKTQNKNIANIQYLEHKHQNNVCIEYERLNIWMEYLNFTLKGLIVHKKDIQIGEIWYCLKSMLEMIRELQINKLIVSLRLENVFLNLKGVPMVFLFHMNKDQQKTHTQRQQNQLASYSMCQQLALTILQLSCMQQLLSQSQQQMQQIQISNMLNKLSQKSSILSQFLSQMFFSSSLQLSQLLQALQLLEMNNKIKLASQIRFNKFRYVLPEDEQKKNQSNINNNNNKMKNLMLDEGNLFNNQNNQNNNNDLMNSYKTPIYRLTDQYNQSGRGNISKFFTASSKEMIRKSFKQEDDNNKNAIQKNIVTSASIVRTNRINSMSRIDKKQNVQNFKETMENENNKENADKLRPYEPINIKPRKKALSVSQQSSQSSKKHQSNQKENMKKQISILQSNGKNILNKSNIINIIKMKTQSGNLFNSNQQGKGIKKEIDLKNSSIVKLSNCMDESGFLESLESKKQKNIEKMSELTLRRQELEQNFKKIKQEDSKNKDKSINKPRQSMKQLDSNKQNCQNTRNRMSNHNIIQKQQKENSIKMIKNNVLTPSISNLQNATKNIREFCKQKTYMNSLKGSFLKKMVG